MLTLVPDALVWYGLIVFDIMTSGPSLLPRVVIISPPSLGFVYRSCL